MTVRELNGWAQKTVTLDADGKVASVAVSQPRFTPREVALLLAARRAKLAPRGSHGLLLSEALDPANQFAFEASKPMTDWAQKALDGAAESYQRAHPKASMSAVRFTVGRRV